MRDESEKKTRFFYLSECADCGKKFCDNCNVILNHTYYCYLCGMKSGYYENYDCVKFFYSSGCYHCVRKIVDHIVKLEAKLNKPHYLEAKKQHLYEKGLKEIEDHCNEKGIQ